MKIIFLEKIEPDLPFLNGLSMKWKEKKASKNVSKIKIGTNASNIKFKLDNLVKAKIGWCQRYALYETKPIFTKKEVFKSLFKIVPSTAEIIIKIHPKVGIKV